MTRQWTKALLGFGTIVAVGAGGQTMMRGQQAPAKATPAHVFMTSQQDRQRVMDQLKITLFPGGPGAYLASTYDERTANPYPVLPDPLTFNDGSKVKTAAQWRRRRAEIVELFDREVYGRRPKNMPKVTWTVTNTTEGMTAGVPVINKQLVGRVDNSGYPELNVTIMATLSTPKNANGPVPVVLMFGGGGTAPAGVPATTQCLPPGTAPAAPRGGGAAPVAGVRGVAPPNLSAAGRGGAPGGGNAPPSANEQIVMRGWGYASVSTASIQADNGQGLTCGIIGLVNKGQPRSLDDWGVLSAWGWGMSKVLDYFETDKAVDAKKVAVQGHSRDGKAALVAIAYDERFLTGFISSSGQSGAKLHRRKYGEAIENIAATNEYHWMAGNYLKYAGRWDTLPVDSHELIAMVAPRPVFLSTGKGPDENPDGTVMMMPKGDSRFQASRGAIELQAANINDAWVDPKGTFLAGVGAGPVYRLLGKKDLGTTEFPKIETGVVTGEIAFRQHSSGHTPGPNWPVFLEFAARYFDASASGR
ncbi:MAG TPA: acetylxylan esterase [Terriglobia bacterium]|nr:acetylxylan esterase [Terriglobia bacterium]